MVLLSNTLLALALLVSAATAADTPGSLDAFTAEHPEVKKLVGDGSNGLNAAYLDDAGKLVKAAFEPSSLEKREPGYGYYSPPNRDETLLALLRKNRGTPFCASYCPPARPRTTTTTVVRHSTTTVRPRVVTTTSTTTARAVDETVTTTIAEATETVTATADAETTTLEETETAPAIVRTVTETTTSTIEMPKHVPTMSVTKRGIAKVPAYLKGYEPARISRVCSSLLPKPSTVTKTRTVTRVITTTAAAARRTVVVTITPTATVTSTVAPTTTETTTETPTITATTTATVTPTATTTIVATKSVCPDQVNGITGISVTPPGSLRFPFAVTAPDCCTACFNTPGCVAWWSVQNSICAYAINSPPNADGTSAVCPSGRGDWSFFDGGSMDGTQVGGRGPCANNRK